MPEQFPLTPIFDGLVTELQVFGAAGATDNWRSAHVAVDRALDLPGPGDPDRAGDSGSQPSE